VPRDAWYDVIPTGGVDEMVDGRGSLRPHWRSLLGVFSGLGEGGLAERARRLDRAFADEGITSILPGAADHAWRCDPVPLPIGAAEFAELEAGLAQRARLMQAILADIYGRQSLLSDGVLPPALVFANPAYLRPSAITIGPGPRPPLMDLYAADLIRGPDGAWRVLADRTAGSAGIAHALENRRMLARVMPEAFRGEQIRQLRPFFDIWQDALHRMAGGIIAADPSGARRTPSIALLTPGTGSPHWFEHMFLSRELACALVEGADLTVRGGAVYLKTLKGLQRVDVLLRRLDGRMIDPVELEAGSLLGVPGLMDAARTGAVRITNDPGAGAAEAPALAAWLPTLCLQLLGERLLLASVPTMWLGDQRARDMVREQPENWLIRPAGDGRAPGTVMAGMTDEQRAGLLSRIEAQPWGYAASAALSPSVAPTFGQQDGGGTGMVPRHVVLRLFLTFDGADWHAMEGGLARVLQDSDRLAGTLPGSGLSKDVWVLNDDRSDIVGPSAAALGPLPIRRTTGDLPSRVADDLFWLGRYVERLETAARLVRAAINRLTRGALLPRELTELQTLAACLLHAGVIEGELPNVSASTTGLTESLLGSARDSGAIARLFGHVARLVEVVRDRLTGDMYSAFTHSLRLAHADSVRARRSLDQLSHAMVGILRFSGSVAGVAAENMVRGGGWLFLELGRRIERAQSVAGELAIVLDQPPSRIEVGLHLVLELCDSVLTYRSRYLTVLQPAPVLDLVLADPGNPRGLAFQLEAIWHLLNDVAGHAEGALPSAVAGLLVESGALVQQLVAAPDQSVEAAGMPPKLRELEAGIAALSDRVTRRYFALLPAAQAVGVGGEAPVLRGAA
jgi:uncharacterized circularly permuted ATP-grasp superfamily protein/uncharacterized alpha-E superfamily protein